MKLFSFGIFKIIFTVLSILLCISLKKYNGYEFIFLIPLVYFFCMIFIKYKKVEYSNNISYLSIDFLTFVKYSIMPMLIVIMNDYENGVLTGQIPSSNYVQEAILLTIIECFIVFFTLYVFNIVHKEKIKVSCITKKIKFGPVIFVFFVISFLLIIKYSSSFFPRQFFVINSDYSTVQIASSVDGLVKIIFTIAKMFFLLFGTQFLIFKYNKNQKFIYIIEIMFLLLVYLGINTSTSRWNLVIPIIIYLYMLKDIWFKKSINKVAISLIVFVLFISFISISMYKFQWLFNNSSDVGIKNVTRVLASQIQEYMSGPRAIAQGIETAEIFSNEISGQTLFNDFAGSIPYVSKFIVQNDRINVYYNYLVKGPYSYPTQIMPTISIGYSYFGYLGCFIFTFLFILFSLKLGVIEAEADNIFLKFISAYMSIWLSMNLGFNTQIIFGFFISTWFPFLIIYYLNKIIILKKR